jgi:SAM-dependent methyltransferase
MPYRGELAIPASHVKPGSTVLELGCGAGQGTRDLLDRGFIVTAVDNSPEMLAHSPGEATSVLADIETLELEQRFDAAILPTGLINHASPTARQGFVASARRHLKVDGWLFVERQSPIWLRTAAVGDVTRSEDVEVHIDAVSRAGETVAMTLRYVTVDGTWLHSFQLVLLEDRELQALFTASGFGSIEWLNEQGSWLRVQACADGA